MESPKSIIDPELAIWERIFIPDGRRITEDQVSYLLNVRFSSDDLARISSLSAKAEEGKLGAEEKVELERYIHVGHLLSILKAKIQGMPGTKQQARTKSNAQSDRGSRTPTSP